MKTTTQEMSTGVTDNDTSAIIDSNSTGTDVKLDLCLSDMQPMQRELPQSTLLCPESCLLAAFSHFAKGKYDRFLCILLGICS